jgi:hypothetical protein
VLLAFSAVKMMSLKMISIHLTAKNAKNAEKSNSLFESCRRSISGSECPSPTLYTSIHLTAKNAKNAEKSNSLFESCRRSPSGSECPSLTLHALHFGLRLRRAAFLASVRFQASCRGRAGSVVWGP